MIYTQVQLIQYEPRKYREYSYFSSKDNWVPVNPIRKKTLALSDHKWDENWNLTNKPQQVTEYFHYFDRMLDLEIFLVQNSGSSDIKII